MKICNYLSPDHIFLNARLTDKESVLRFIADTCNREGIAEDTGALYKGIKKREQTMSTGIGNGIGLPHTTNNEVTKATVFLIRLENSIDFDAVDESPVDIILALIIPENQTALHIQILAGVSRLCQNSNFIKTIRKADDPITLSTKIEELERKMAFH